MTTPILVTKLFIPATRPELVPRPRLIARLNSGLHRKLTLVSAPAGFGKTTLVTDWLQAAANPDKAIPNQQPLGNANNQTVPQQLPNVNQIAWFSLDEEDNDPTRFITYMVSALNRSVDNEAPFCKGILEMLQSSQPTVSQTILTTLINEIAAIDSKVILVLDDYHLIDAEPIHEALEFLLENLPPQLHLVIATREDPPLSLSRLRVRDHLTELRAADLRFSSSEAAVFLNQAMGLNLTSDEITALEIRTEGWIAGLQLAALSLQGRTDKRRLIESFTGSNRLVLDYLIEEVLNRQPDAIQQFLLQTAVLDRLTGSLCDALTGQDNGQETLELLEQTNLFIIPLDAERRWYRYHHLLADLLRQRLRQTQWNEGQRLHRQASTWYVQNGLVEQAIEHALKAKDYAQMVRLLKDSVDAIWRRGEHAKLRRFLAALPEEWVCTEPTICIFHAWYLFAGGRQEAAEQVLQAAEQTLAQSKSERPLPEFQQQKLLGRAAAIRAFMASFRGDMSEIIAQARRALAHLPEDDLTWRSSAAITLGDAHSFQGDMIAAYEARFAAAQACQASGDNYFFMIASLKLAVTMRTQGKLHPTIQMCRQQLALANEKGWSQSPVVGWCLAVWSEVLAELNHLDEALQKVQTALELVEKGVDLAMIGWSYLCAIRILFSRQELTEAEALIHKMTEADRGLDVPPWIMHLMEMWQIRLWLAQNNLAAASQWAAAQEPFGKNGSQLTLDIFTHNKQVALAHVMLAQGRLAATSTLLQQILPFAETSGRLTAVIEILLLQALATQAAGNMSQAVATLGKACAIAEPKGFVRIFVDQGQSMRSLLFEALKYDIAPTYVQHLLAAFSSNEPLVVQSVSSPVNQTEFIEPLSERECEVLQCISSGLSNREIANQLYLSLNTVKVHTRNIYSKLDVHSRIEAVSKAKDLGFLPPV